MTAERSALGEAAAAVLAFWEDAGADVAAAQAIVRAAPAPRAPAPAAPAAPAKITAAAGGSAAKRAAAADTIEALRAAAESHDGGGLKAHARRPVFAEGPFDAPVVVVGERPGIEEDEQGRPFVGRSGRLLDAMLGSIGLSRARNALLTNIVYWRPPGDRPLTQAEIAAGLPFCERLLALVRPQFVIALGGVAAQALLKRDDGVMRLRGKALTYPGLQPAPPAAVLLPPAYLLRRPQDKAQTWADLLSIADRLESLGVR